MHNTIKQRLFFGMEIDAPWPSIFPKGRLLAPFDRHLTLAFLGNRSLEELLPQLDHFPRPPFSVGLAAFFDRILFLPERHARVASFHVELLEHADSLQTLRNILSENNPQESIDHVTLARAPFDRKEWEEAFHPLPLICGNIHLYESLGFSRTKIHWTWPLATPFTEIEHVADMAFFIRGTTIEELCIHAFLALAFNFPPLLNYRTPLPSLLELGDAIFLLNEWIARADTQEPCPFKAVSMHQKIIQQEHYLEWEMIVDV